MSNDISKKKGKSSSEKKTKRKAKRRETYAMYIYKVLKQVGGRAWVKKKKLLRFFPDLKNELPPPPFTRFIRTRGFQAEPWASWTPSSMTCLRGFLQKRPGWLSTINAPPSPAERCKLQWGCCCPGSWQNTPCLRAPRRSRSTPAPNEDLQHAPSCYDQDFNHVY